MTTRAAATGAYAAGASRQSGLVGGGTAGSAQAGYDSQISGLRKPARGSGEAPAAAASAAYRNQTTSQQPTASAAIPGYRSILTRQKAAENQSSGGGDPYGFYRG